MSRSSSIENRPASADRHHAGSRPSGNGVGRKSPRLARCSRGTKVDDVHEPRRKRRPADIRAVDDRRARRRLGAPVRRATSPAAQDAARARQSGSSAPRPDRAPRSRRRTHSPSLRRQHRAGQSSARAATRSRSGPRTHRGNLRCSIHRSGNRHAKRDGFSSAIERHPVEQRQRTAWATTTLPPAPPTRNGSRHRISLTVLQVCSRGA